MYVPKWFLLKGVVQYGRNTFSCSTIEKTQLAVVSTNFYLTTDSEYSNTIILVAMNCEHVA